MTQLSSGWLPSGMAGFRCLNSVITFDPSFCLSLGSVLFPVGTTLRQVFSPGDLWQLQAYNFLTPSPVKRENFSLSTFLTKLPELSLTGSDPITVAKKQIILIGSHVYTWLTWIERKMLPQKREVVVGQGQDNEKLTSAILRNMELSWQINILRL